MDLADHKADAVQEKLSSYIGLMSFDEQIALVAVTRLGQKDNEASNWPVSRTWAMEAHNEQTAINLLGMRFVEQYLQKGL